MLIWCPNHSVYIYNVKQYQNLFCFTFFLTFLKDQSTNQLIDWPTKEDIRALITEHENYTKPVLILIGRSTLILIESCEAMWVIIRIIKIIIMTMEKHENHVIQVDPIRSFDNIAVFCRFSFLTVIMARLSPTWWWHILGGNRSQYCA